MTFDFSLVSLMASNQKGIWRPPPVNRWFESMIFFCIKYLSKKAEKKCYVFGLKKLLFGINLA